MTITTHDLFAHSLRLEDGKIRIEESARNGCWTLAAFRVTHADDIHPTAGRSTPTPTKPCACSLAQCG